MGNWITEFNKVERQAYNMTYELGGRLEQIYNEGYGNAVYDLCVKTLIETKYNNKKFNSIDEKFKYIMSKFNEIATKSIANDKFVEMVKKQADEIDLNKTAVSELVYWDVVRKCVGIDYNKFKNRLNLLEFRLSKQLDAYQKLFLGAILAEEGEVKAELNEYVLDFTEKYENKKLEEIRELENLTIEKCKYIKIFDYKKMCKLAKDKGFKPKRTKGDHLMYEHTKTKQLVPIPAHELGYGIMREIQKELNEKSIA
ncbi:type II toxin-antitoxin system HicA family toxin (plasmid) [Clostridium perfringens]|uniref:type II toxin-antitoxin system HicA family toxin n=1 Tax=Clostridium perfringens TaxID=1502 RepID=UPI000DF105FD|nr:type II toxin-antitoxin system HicA family toxin [Clostridium perfringens]MCX0416284.1 type II toxin-antitoxin system HicA family toxin [Clostridium perfringens]MDU5649658.1 type II toxin-antitoxin system HicA family toxin [Clostridium perfringens]NGT07381.1 type II toxin-antitoxin system HicA family toxin [Clostridium perfringens]STB67876.1 YcfA-like protein [Clostridium perfringens]